MYKAKARAILRRLPMKTSACDTRRCHPGSRRLPPGRILLWAPPLVQYQPRRKPAKPVTTQERTSRKKTSVRSPTESSWVTTGSMRSPPTCGPHKLWTRLSQNGPSRVPIPKLRCSCHSHINVIMQHLAPHFLFKHNSCNSFSRCVMGKVTTPTGWLNIWCPESPAVLLSAHCPSSCKWGSSSGSDGAVGAPQELVTFSKITGSSECEQHSTVLPIFWRQLVWTMTVVAARGVDDQVNLVGGAVREQVLFWVPSLRCLDMAGSLKPTLTIFSSASAHAPRVRDGRQVQLLAQQGPSEVVLIGWWLTSQAPPAQEHPQKFRDLLGYYVEKVARKEFASSVRASPQRGLSSAYGGTARLQLCQSAFPWLLNTCSTSIE